MPPEGRTWQGPECCSSLPCCEPCLGVGVGANEGREGGKEGGRQGNKQFCLHHSLMLGSRKRDNIQFYSVKYMYVCWMYMCRCVCRCDHLCESMSGQRSLFCVLFSSFSTPSSSPPLTLVFSMKLGFVIWVMLAGQQSPEISVPTCHLHTHSSTHSTPLHASEQGCS